MTARIYRLRWMLARWLYWSPLRPLWSFVAPNRTADELAEVRLRAQQRAERARRNFS